MEKESVVNLEGTISFLKQEMSLFNRIKNDVVNLSKDFADTEEFYMKNQTMKNIQDKEISDIITRIVFLRGELERVKIQQETTISAIGELKYKIEKINKINNKKETKETTENELKQSELFQVNKEIQESPLIAVSFFDSFRIFCENGNLFFQRKIAKCSQNKKKDIVLYRKRPLIEILKEEGRKETNIPRAIEEIIGELQNRGLLEGIFRTVAQSKKIESIINRLSVTDFKQLSPIELASILKKFINEIPNGIIDAQIQNSLLLLWEIPDLSDEEKTKQSILLLQNLPPPNYALLKQLLSLNFFVHKNSSATRMNSSNLAIIWTPIFFDPIELFQKLNLLSKIVSNLILVADRF